MTRYFIIGNGAAGVSAAETLRQEDPVSDITILGAEPYPMYSRPGLAYVLTNDIPQNQIIARTPEWYTHLRIDFIHGTAVQIDIKRQLVLLEDGRALSYDRLLIATGARATPPPYPGSDLKGVVFLDTLDGTKALAKQAKRGRRGVVIGGGITALEMTEGFEQRGVETHYFLRRDRLWGRVFNDDEAALLEQKMLAHGVHIHRRTEVAEILGNRRGRVRAVRLKSGEEFKCDLVGVGIGVRPLIDVVKGSSIKTDRGILVNNRLQTSAPHVYAAGDCAQVYDRWSKQYMLDILWPSAVAEGKAAALNMAGHQVDYEKGSPFNACLLFGLHIAVMGQINPTRDESEEPEVIQHLSRGSSEVWHTYQRHYDSAWSQHGANMARLVIDGNYLAGALLIGEQHMADPLRHIIENRVNIENMLPAFKAGGAHLRRSIEQYWKNQTAVLA